MSIELERNIVVIRIADRELSLKREEMLRILWENNQEDLKRIIVEKIISQ